MPLSHEHGAALERLRSVMSAPKAEAYFELTPTAEALGVRPFVTISRLAFAGGHALAERLAARLNSLGVGPAPWTVWDHELVEKVAAESHIAREVIEAFENASPHYIQDFLAGIMVPRNPNAGQAYAIYRRLAITIRSLAQTGQVIIVGRGATFITRGMRGGVHLWLVADRDWRVRQAAKALHLTESEAAHRVQEIDRGRAGFYRQFWPNHPLSPELFHLTLNAELLPEERAVDSVLPIVQSIQNLPIASPMRHA